VEEAILRSEIDNVDFEVYRKEGKMERGNRIITLLRICCDSQFIFIFVSKRGLG